MVSSSFNTVQGHHGSTGMRQRDRSWGFATLTGWMDGSSTPPDTPSPALIPVSTLPSQVLMPRPGTLHRCGSWLSVLVFCETEFSLGPPASLPLDAKHSAGYFLLLPLSMHRCPRLLTCYQREGGPRSPPCPSLWLHPPTPVSLCHEAQAQGQ